MASTIKLSKADARRALVRHHFAPCATQMEVFDRLRSIQFDPIAPVGCNHDLVLQSRLEGYKIGDWNKTAYEDRLVYDGWDKQASLVPYEGWPLRRLIHGIHRQWFEQKIFVDHKEAVDLILKEISDRGPLMPKECEFQQRREEWKVSWHGPSVTKQTLRALWHSGLVMTAGRKNGQHLYDLTERVVPEEYYSLPKLDDDAARVELAFERHRAMGLLRPNAGPEIWTYQVLHYVKKDLIAELLRQGRILPVEIEGMKVHATPEFLELLDQPSLDPAVRFIAPLDQLLWDRKFVAHVFEFDYIWEIYTPEVKRKWGYYVLPILFGDQLVARVEFWCRDEKLEIKVWHTESSQLTPEFYQAFGPALKRFMRYCGASKILVADGVDKKIKGIAAKLRP